MLSLFDFGKKRRRTVRRKSTKTRKASKGSRKPPARLLKICKKYHVKTTRKVGGKRVYKPTKMLAKMCLKKSMKARKSHFGNKMMMTGGMHHKSSKMHDKMMPAAAFGKRRGRKVSKAAAMKAFRSFYKRHCAGMRRSRFGYGGNPPLMNSMGYEFCPSGMGGVLGANSTGLFPSPCTSMNIAQAQTEANATLPAYTNEGIGAAATSSQLTSYANQFGLRRRRRRSMAVGKRKSAVGARRRRRTTAVGAKRRSTAVGARRRRRRSTAVGSRRKSAVGAKRRTRRRCY